MAQGSQVLLLELINTTVGFPYRLYVYMVACSLLYVHRGPRYFYDTVLLLMYETLIN